MGSRSRAGAIFCLRRRSLKNKLHVAPCCGVTSSSAKEPFCQTFSRMASAPPEKLLLQRSQSRSHFQRSHNPTKQAHSQCHAYLAKSLTPHFTRYSLNIYRDAMPSESIGSYGSGRHKDCIQYLRCKRNSAFDAAIAFRALLRLNMKVARICQIAIQ